MIAEVSFYYCICIHCGEVINPGDIRITTPQSRPRHLECTKPVKCQPLSIDNFQISPSAKSYRNKIEEFVSQWNQQFVFSEGNVPAGFIRKSVQTVCPSNKRLLIEAFSYLKMREIECIVAVVSKGWLHISRDEELWKICYLHESNIAPTSHNSYRKLYVISVLNSCWFCDGMLSLSSIAVKFEECSRVLCKSCFKRKECALIPIIPFSNRKAVHRSTIRSLRIPEVNYGEVPCCFLYSLSVLFIPYAEQRKKELLEALYGRYAGRILCGEVAEVEHFGIWNFYVTEVYRSSVITRVQRYVATFIGKCGKEEDIEKGIETFLRDVEKCRNGH